MWAGSRGIGGGIEDVPAFQRRRFVHHFDMIARLDQARTCPQLGVVQQQTIADAQLTALLPRKQFCVFCHFDDRKLWRALRLTVEYLSYGGYCFKLEVLVGVEL